MRRTLRRLRYRYLAYRWLWLSIRHARAIHQEAADLDCARHTVDATRAANALRQQGRELRLEWIAQRMAQVERQIGSDEVTS